MEKQKMTLREKWKGIPRKQKKDAIVTFGILGLVLGIAFGGIALTKAILKTNYPFVVVTSGSMVPTIEIGDVLIMKGVDPATIEVGDHANRTGDIILYDTEGLWMNPAPYPVIHRCVDRYWNTTDNQYYFTAWGDHNFAPDAYPIPADRILGIVAAQIPKIGKVKLFLDEQNLVGYIIGGLSILLIVSIVWDLSHPDEEEEKTSKTKEESASNIPDKL